MFPVVIVCSATFTEGTLSPSRDCQQGFQFYSLVMIFSRRSVALVLTLCLGMFSGLGNQSQSVGVMK